MSQVGTDQQYPLGTDDPTEHDGERTGRRQRSGETLATALGWFSMALGIAQLGVTALDVMCASELGRSRAAATRETAARNAAIREEIRQDAIRRGEVKRAAPAPG